MPLYLPLWQAPTDYTVLEMLVKRRWMPCRKDTNTAVVAGGIRRKDDRKQSTMALLVRGFHFEKKDII